MHFGITETPTTDCVSLYNNTGLISKVSEETASENAENCHCRQHHCRFTPFPRDPHECPHKSYNIARNYSHRATFLPLIIWIYLQSNFCGGPREMHLFCSRVRIILSRSSKVVYDFLLVIISNFGPILHHFWHTARYWLKIANLSYPTDITPSLGMNPFEFLDELFIAKTSPWAIRRWRFRDPSLRCFDSASVWQMDGQLDHS